MVPADGTHQLDQQVFVVNTLKETAVYVERMPGGVRGGGREAPLYSIPQLNSLTFSQSFFIFSECIVNLQSGTLLSMWTEAATPSLPA
jgi:hypothetical protein